MSELDYGRLLFHSHLETPDTALPEMMLRTSAHVSKGVTTAIPDADHSREITDRTDRDAQLGSGVICSKGVQVPHRGRSEADPCAHGHFGD